MNDQYCVINYDGTATPVSETERGAKSYATRNGYSRVGRMSWINNMIVETWVKTSRGWIFEGD